MKALAVSEKHNLTRYVCQQVNYSLIARDVEHEIVPLALDQAVGLMAWSPLQAGLLSGKCARSAPLAKNRSGWPSLSKSITPTPEPNVSTMCFSADAPFSWRNVMPDSAATLLNCTGRACRGSGLAACWLQRGKGAESSSVESHTRRYVGKMANVFGGCKSRRRQQVFFGYTGRIFAQRHIGKVQQPPGLEIVRPQLERCEEVLDGFLRIRTLGVMEFGTNRKEAALRGMAVYPVDHFRPVEVRHA
jgi:hypothetical protein